MSISHSLLKSLDEISFVEREKVNGKYVKNRCGRDFLYYSLNYIYPNEFNSKVNNPVQIERKKLFGWKISAFFAWTQLQFVYLPEFLRTKNLELFINKKEINTYYDFFDAILYSRIKVDKAINIIETRIKENKIVGLDIPIKFKGLLDHVMFVYAFDNEFFYVCDTNKVSGLNYEKIGTQNFFMKISKEEVRSKWNTFARVWEIDKII
jgi:hypothetical protein